MPDNDPKQKDGSQFPPDLGLICSFFFLLLAVLYVACALSWAKGWGDRTLFQLALILGFVGVVLLFTARIPLYRRKRFFTFGPSSLSGIYRKLYFTAYMFIVPSIVLLVLLLLALA
jgi:hypothetical protein